MADIQGQRITELTQSSSPVAGDKILMDSAASGARGIDYNQLADAILNRLTSKTYSLDAGTKTLIAALNDLNSNLTVKTGSFTFESAFEGAGNSLTILESGNVVTINGYIDGLTITASNNYRIGRITGVSLPPQPIRVRGACGNNAYTPGGNAYFGLTRDGILTVYSDLNGTTIYFSMSYIAS